MCRCAVFKYCGFESELALPVHVLGSVSVFLCTWNLIFRHVIVSTISTGVFDKTLSLFPLCRFSSHYTIYFLYRLPAT